MLGDFNALLPSQDKNGPLSSSSASLAFRNIIRDLGLIDLPLTNKAYTWSNDRRLPTLSVWTGYSSPKIGTRISRILSSGPSRGPVPTVPLCCSPHPPSSRLLSSLDLSLSGLGIRALVMWSIRPGHPQLPALKLCAAFLPKSLEWRKHFVPGVLGSLLRSRNRRLPVFFGSSGLTRWRRSELFLWRRAFYAPSLR